MIPVAWGCLAIYVLLFFLAPLGQAAATPRLQMSRWHLFSPLLPV